MNVLEIRDLHKQFGSHKVIDGVSIDVPKNSIYGFLGQNGAGKTTTMNMIVGLLAADSGSIRVCGKEVKYGETKINATIGYLPDVPSFYGYMKPLEYLKMCGEISGMKADKITCRSKELIKLVGLEEVNRKIGGFSRGMKQRLGVAQALLHEPQLLICDEPTSALDPLGRKELLDILKQVKQQTTVLFSTHILSDVESICDEIAILHQGRIVMSGNLEELKVRHSDNVITMSFFAEEEQNSYTEGLLSVAGVKDIETKDRICHIQVEDMKETGKLLLKRAVDKKLSLQCYEVQEPSLEKMFLEVIK